MTSSPAGPVTATERPLLDAQLASAAAATPWRTVPQAEQAGFSDTGEPGPLFHLVRPQILDATFDLTQPEMLLADRRTGRIDAIVYFVLVPFGDPPPQGFAGGSDVWHSHDNICRLSSGALTGAKPQRCSKLGGRAQGNWMLHVWQVPGVSNPNGVFAEFAPGS
jgi:hypothetical protein